MKISGYKILLLFIIIFPYYYLNTHLSLWPNKGNETLKIIMLNLSLSVLLIIFLSITSLFISNVIDDLFEFIVCLFEHVFKYPIKLLKYLDKLLTKEYKL